MSRATLTPMMFTRTRFAVVQQRLGASGLARTLHLENPSVPVTVITLPSVAPAPGEVDDVISNVVKEIAATTEFTEVRYEADGSLRSRRLPDALRHDGAPPLYYVMLHGWMRLFGTGTVAVRALSGLLGVVALPLTFAAGLRAGGRRTASCPTPSWLAWTPRSRGPASSARPSSWPRRAW